MQKGRNSVRKSCCKISLESRFPGMMLEQGDQIVGESEKREQRQI